MKEIRRYNNLDIELGSLVLEQPKVLRNINSHFSSEEKPSRNHNWFYRFNSEVNEMSNFISMTKDRKCLLDIGSQFGSFSLSFIGDSKEKYSYAFDGGMHAYMVMLQTKFKNDLTNLYPFNFLIGDKNEPVWCYSEELQTLALVVKDQAKDIRQMFEVDLLCDILELQPDTMKIDIEGCEHKALTGSVETIMKYKPIIFIEVHPMFIEHYDTKIVDIVNFVEKIDYNVLDLKQNRVTDYEKILTNEKTDSNRTIWVPK